MRAISPEIRGLPDHAGGGLKRYKEHPAYLRIDGRPVVYLYQVATKRGLTAAEFPLLRKHVESEVGPVYWIVDKIAHDAKAANAGDLAREKRISADWLVTTGVDSFAFYSTFSNFRAHDYDALAGIVYQEVPQPGNPGNGRPPRAAAECGYRSGTILGGSGHLCVIVTSARTVVKYVGPSDIGAAIAHTYEILP